MCLEGLMETVELISYDSQPQGRCLNPEFPEYDAGLDRHVRSKKVMGTSFIYT
jgi:hypothetical protein